MQATHPLTGKKIRIIQTDASLWKEHKALDFTDADKSAKSDTAYTSGSPTFLIQLAPTNATELTEATKKSLIVFLSKKAFVQDEEDKPIRNIVYLDDIHETYPHIGEPWDGSVEDAATIIAVLIGHRALRGTWNKRAEKLGLVRLVAEPFRLWWLTQYYVPSGERGKEIRTCLERNANSSVLDRIVVLNEKPEKMPKGKVVIEERVIGKRLSYADVIRAAATFPPDVVVAFANADICIDDRSWRNLWSANLQDKFLALLRYDVPKSGNVAEAEIFGPRADSQDTWVIRVADILARGAESIAKTVDFHFGRMGCDNAIALHMLRHKFTVTNPCLTLKTWHFHNSAIRTYNKDEVVESDVFHYIHPSGLHDLQPLLILPKEVVLGKFRPIDLHRPLRGGGATNWLSAYNRKLATGQVALKMENNNTLISSDEFILSVPNCFQTPLGVVYDKDKMFIGKTERSQNIWASAVMSAMTQSIECDKCLVAPWPEAANKSRESYVLQYLSKILQLVPEGPAEIVKQGWEFFCADKKEVIEAMEVFTWNTRKLPVIKHEKDIVVWCKESRVMMASDNAYPLAEDIGVLRKYVKGWRNDFANKQRLRVVIVEDGEVLTESLVKELEDVMDRAFEVRVVYPSRTSAHRMIDVFSGAWGVVCRGGIETCGWNWMMPAGAYVFEVLSSTMGGADSYGLGLSAAAGLEHRYCPWSPDKTAQANKIFDEVWHEEETWKASGALSGAAADELPLIVMPRRDLDGYFGHPGDSFREMVRLWAGAGLCRIKEHAIATMVWWGEIGSGILLYDRPNHDWRLAAPLIEKEWKFGLFGNPKPPSAAGKLSSPWFFWPRRPEFVEELAPLAHAKNWSGRKPGLVFYGKTENKVQEKRRTTADWKSACSEWVMVKGDEKYPFTQREYLEKLSESRFGLCLAGYGYKCHREVECMAMGCVPVCAPEVDMDSYANPPSAGVHYIRVSNPEEAARITEEMGEEAWAAMSAAGIAWWKENCSCEGSFALTKKLIDGFQA